MSGPDSSASVSLWNWRGLKFWRLVKRARQEFWRGQLDARSAQFAYYSMLTLTPLLIVVLAAISKLPLEGVLTSFLESTGQVLPRSSYEVIVAQIRGIEEHSSLQMALVSLVVFGYAGHRVFLTISRGLNAVHGNRETRPFWRIHGVALLLTLVAFLILIAALVLLVLGPMTSHWIATMVDLSWVDVLLHGSVRVVIVAVAVLLSTSIIYWLAPCSKTRIQWLTPGAVFATLGWIACSQGFRIYVGKFAHHNETYGALGGVLMLLVWLYLTGGVLLMGGVINHVLEEAQREKVVQAVPDDGPE